jgi:AAA15 family ATPase/GTPase
VITRLGVKHFKSIKKMDLECRRVNVFIGEPNTGKSNILETLGTMSACGYGEIEKFVRFETPSNLFYDDVLDEPIKIDVSISNPSGGQLVLNLEIKFRNNQYLFFLNNKDILKIDDYGEILQNDYSDSLAFIKSYRYEKRQKLDTQMRDFLHPPDGRNLYFVMLHRGKLKSRASELFKSMGLNLGIKKTEKTIEGVKHIDDIYYSYPYVLLSDTLKRMLFLISALETNEHSTLVFEEPESESFPFYTKELAEFIAMDDRNNQFFISTHNPYFLESVSEKTPTDDLCVNIVFKRDYQTKVRTLTPDEVSEMLDIEPFFNIENFIDE